MNFFFAVLLTLLWPWGASADFAHEYNTGIYFYKRGEYALAAKSFDRMTARFSGDPRIDAALYWGGQSYDRIGQYADALERYKSVISDFPKSTYRMDAYYAAGVSSSNAYAYPDALGFFSEVVRNAAPEGEEFPGPAADLKTVLNARVKITETLLKMEDDRKAEAALRELISLPQLPNDRRAEAELRLRQLMVRTGRAAEARAAFARAARNSDLYQAEDYMYRGDAAFAEGKFGESRSWYEQIFRKQGLPPEFRAQAQYQAARASQEMGDLEKAAVLYKDAYEERDALPAVRAGSALQLAYLNRTAGKPREAEVMASQGEKIAEGGSAENVKDDLLYFRAESAYQQKKFDEALSHLSRINESSYRVNRLNGRLLLEDGRPDDAAPYLERAAVQAPDDNARNSCLLDIAKSHMAARRFEQALTHLDRIRRPSESMEALVSPLHAQALMELGRFSEAAREYSALAARSAQPGDARRYRYFSALASLKDKNFSWAEKLLSDLSAVGGVPQGDDDNPSAFLDAAMRLDQAIDFASPGKDRPLQDQIDSLLERNPHPRLYAFVIDRLYAKERFSLLPRYSQTVYRAFAPSDDAEGLIRGRAAYYELKAREKMGDREGMMRALDELSKSTAAGVRLTADQAEDADFLRARMLQESGDRAGAKEAYVSYAKKFPSGKNVKRAFMEIANMSMEDNRPEDAEEAFMNLIAGKSPDEIKADPVLSAAASSLASIRVRQNRHSEAAALLEPLQDADSFKDDPDYQYKLGAAHLSAGRIQDAVPHFRNAIEHPKVSAETRDRALDSLFTALQKLRNDAVIESDYRRYASQIKNRSVHSKAKYSIGMSLFRAERYAAAAPYLEGVVDPPGSDMVIEAGARMGDCDYYLKRYKEAMDRYTRIVKSYPNTKWAQECYYTAQLCKIKLGLAGDAIGGYERFLQQNPNASQAPLVAFEAAKLYIQAEDPDAAERMLDLFEKKAEGAMLEESIRMRLSLAKKRGQAEKLIALAKTHRAKYGMDMDVAVDAAVAATQIGDLYDPFDLKPQVELTDMVKKLESAFVSPRAKAKTMSVEEKFFDRGSKGLNDEHTLNCVLKRILFTPTRVLLVVEVRAVGFLTSGTKIRIKKLSVGGEDLNQTAGAFVSAIQIGEEFSLRHNQTRLIVVSILRDDWSADVKINADVDFAGRELLLYCSVKGIKDG